MLGIIEVLGTPAPQAPTRCSHGTNTNLRFACGDNTLEPDLPTTDHRATAPRHAPDIHLGGVGERLGMSYC